MDLLSRLSSHFSLYITLKEVDPLLTYDWITDDRNFVGEPRIHYDLHGDRCKAGETWVYVAVPEDAGLSTLSAGQRLYVGSQTQDRMFRGPRWDDGRVNFHHPSMRSGNGEDNLITYLRGGRVVRILRANGNSIATDVSGDPSFAQLLGAAAPSEKKHFGWVFEQALLAWHPWRSWRWNTRGPNRRIKAIVLKMQGV